MKEDKSNWLLGGSILAAFIASLCCTGPVVLIALGLSGFVAASYVESLRPLFMVLAVILLGFAWYRLLRSSKNVCAKDSTCERKPLPKWNKTILSIVTIVVITIAGFPHLSIITGKAVSDQFEEEVEALAGSRLEVHIPSMECSACAVSIQSALESRSGIFEAIVNFDTKNAIIIYNELIIGKNQIYQIIKQTGFKAEPI